MIYLVVKTDQVSELDKQLINRLMTAVDITEYEIINIRFFRLKDKNSFHICLGDEVYKSTKLFVEKLDKLIRVSSLSDLYDLPQNEKSRAETYHQLKNLNKYINIINNNNQINPNILTSINSINLNTLKQELINNNITGFTALDNQGKKVRVHLNKQDLVNEDINISIEELITLKLIQEVFDINNPIIVNKGEKNNE